MVCPAVGTQGVDPAMREPAVNEIVRECVSVAAKEQQHSRISKITWIAVLTDEVTDVKSGEKIDARKDGKNGEKIDGMTDVGEAIPVVVSHNI